MSRLLKNKEDSMHEEETIFPVSGIPQVKTRQWNSAGNGTVGVAGGKVVADGLAERNVPELCGKSLCSFACILIFFKSTLRQ